MEYKISVPVEDCWRLIQIFAQDPRLTIDFNFHSVFRHDSMRERKFSKGVCDADSEDRRFISFRGSPDLLNIRVPVDPNVALLFDLLGKGFDCMGSAAYSNGGINFNLRMKMPYLIGLLATSFKDHLGSMLVTCPTGLEIEIVPEEGCVIYSDKNLSIQYNWSYFAVY